MIVPMMKVYLAARGCDRDELLRAVRELGVVHLTPVDPARVPEDSATAEHIQALKRAQQVLYGIEPGGETPALEAVEAAHEVLAIERRIVEDENRLALLHHELEQLDLWGNLRLEQIDSLRRAGVDVRVYLIHSRDLADVRADCVAEIGEMSNGRIAVAVAGRGASWELPADAQPLPWPARDAPTLRTEAAGFDTAIKAGHRRHAELARLVPQMRAAALRLESEAQFSQARRGGLASGDLFAVQGWIPAELTSQFSQGLAETGLPTAVRQMPPADDEAPPTLIRTPAWARPIEGLFRILGTVAGYREFDVSVPFLLTLPIFTAILIGDAGYGLTLLLGLTLGYRRAATLLGPQFTRLMIVISAATMVWGGLTASFFGFAFYSPLIPVDLSEHSRTFLMRMCFWMAAIHLSLAQLWPAVRLFPNLQFLNRVGWAVFIWGMLGVVQMFVLKTSLGWDTPWPYLLIVGAVLAILFAAPGRNIIKMLVIGLANFPLSMLSAFSDVISYVRLMAVGLASGVLGQSFNAMAADLGFWPLMALVFLFGHSLNIGLGMIAMFAHGVRLNMLEFCNNLGMQWTGYQYDPFAQRMTQECGS